MKQGIVHVARVGLAWLTAAMVFAFSTMPFSDSVSAEVRAPTLSFEDYVFPATGHIKLIRPQGMPKSVVLSLSDTSGWTPADTELAERLAASGALVAGITTPAFLQRLHAGRGCINANYALIDLARDVQHRAKVPMYMKPVLLGRGQGGTLAYAALASGPSGSYKAAISIGFTRSLLGGQPWCQTGVLKAAVLKKPHTHIAFTSGGTLPSPWVVLAAGNGYGPLKTFVSATGNARLDEVGPGAVPQQAVVTATMPFIAPPVSVMPTRAGEAPLPPDLPITIVSDSAAPRTDMMAVLYSGDGGWAGLDRDVAAALARAGVPVVGIDSLSYFWSERTPTGAAADLDAIIRGYSDHWQRPKVVLVGYSFGADALPYIVGHLAPDARSRVRKMTLLGLSATAEFQFHLSSWLDVASSDAYPTIPAISRLRGLPMLCIQGADEDDSACPSIPKGIAQVRLVPGGHHFDGNAVMLAQAILSDMPR